eukprot:COSAG02_NODE_4171_length_5675_cov_2.909254_2_plen_963_part_00
MFNAHAKLALDASAVATCQKRWLPSVPTGTPPAPRCSHTATQLAGGQKHKFLVVGGGSCSDDDEWTHYGDVYEFDAHAQAWTELVPAEGSPLLPPRRGHCAGVYAKRGLLYVFGGTSGGTGLSELRNDFWRLSLAGSLWEKLPTTGATPPGRRGGMSALSESQGQMWVFGGYVGVYPGFDQNMYRFDLAEETWHKVQANGSAPFLALASCALIEKDREHPQLVVFGGSCYDPAQPARGLSNDLWLCDLASAHGGVTWSRLETEGTVPSPRFSHGCAQLHDCVVVFGGTGRDEETGGNADQLEPQTKTYNDTHILDLRRPVPLWKEALELDSSVAPSARNGYTLVPCGADFILFGGGIYGEKYHNDVHIFRLALQGKVSIPAGCPHRSVAEDFSALLWSEMLADCILEGQSDTEKGILAHIPMHKSILYARCPALRRRLAQAQTQLQAAATGARAYDGAKVVVKVDSLFKAEHCQDGEECDALGGVVRRWPSALRSFACWLYTGALWPAGPEWGSPADMDRPEYGKGRDFAHPHDHLNMVIMDRLVALNNIARPLCLPALASKCMAEAQAIHERMKLRLWKHRESWVERGLVPSAGTPAVGGGCEWAVDEHCRIECGASNFKLASKLKATGNAMFKQGKFDEAKAAYEQALERAATVAFSKQFGGWRECGSCEACASGSFRDCAQPAPSTDASVALDLWTTLLSNRAECWLRAGVTSDTPINTGAMAAAVLVDSPYGALGADPGHAKSRSRRERAIVATKAEHEAASNRLASDVGSLLLAVEDLSSISTAAAGDAVLRVGDTLLRAHRCILVARTEYFRNAFTGEFAEAKPGTDGVVEVELDDVEPRVMRELLWCIYTGEPPEPTVEILAAAHRFGCEVVQIQCEALFVDAIDVEQVCDVLLLAEHYGRLQLRAMAIAYIADHQEDVEETEGWSRLSPVLLEEIALVSTSGEAVRETAIPSRA